MRYRLRVLCRLGACFGGGLAFVVYAPATATAPGARLAERVALAGRKLDAVAGVRGIVILECRSGPPERRDGSARHCRAAARAPRLLRGCAGRGRRRLRLGPRRRRRFHDFRGGRRRRRLGGFAGEYAKSTKTGERALAIEGGRTGNPDDAGARAGFRPGQMQSRKGALRRDRLYPTQSEARADGKLGEKLAGPRRVGAEALDERRINRAETALGVERP